MRAARFCGSGLQVESRKSKVESRKSEVESGKSEVESQKSTVPIGKLSG